MYNKVECIVITCDNCDETYTDEHSGFSIYSDENAANDACQNDDWESSEKGKHYCPLCYKINDEDELIINAERTKAITPSNQK